MSNSEGRCLPVVPFAQPGKLPEALWAPGGVGPAPLLDPGLVRRVARVGGTPPEHGLLIEFRVSD